MIQKYTITGMSCGGCAHNVQEMLSEIDGVMSSHVDLATHTASVETTDGLDIDMNKYFRNSKYTLIKEEN